MINVNDNVMLNPENVIIAEQKGSMYKLTLNNGKILYVNKDVYEDIIAYEPVDKEYVDSKLSGALKRLIVTELPVTDIDTNTVYMILDEESSEEGNVYNEYMYISNAWELIGSTKASGPVYSAGTNVSIVDNVISAADTTYTAGTGIEITDGVIKNTIPEGIQRPATAPSSVKSMYGRFSNESWKSITMPKPGTSTFYGNYVFRFKNHTYYYYSSETSIYEFDKSTKTWFAKNWTEFTASVISYGKGFWTDGKTLFFKLSSGTSYLKYDETTDTWTQISISGINSSNINFDAANIWTHGGMTYYSDNNTQKYLSEYNGTYSWYDTTWSGLTKVYGAYIWTDGVNVYHTDYNKNTYVLDRFSYNTWKPITIKNMPSQWYPIHVWADGENVYYDLGNTHLVLDKTSLAWSTYGKSGITGDNIGGNYVWTDGNDYYLTYSNSTRQRIKNEVFIGRTCLSPYATETYVDDAVAGAGGGKQLYAHHIWHHYASAHQTWFTIITNSSTPFTFDNLVQWFKDNGLTESSKAVIASGKAPMISGTQDVVYVCSVFVSTIAAPTTLSYTTMDSYNARISSNTITDTVVAL